MKFAFGEFIPVWAIIQELKIASKSVSLRSEGQQNRNVYLEISNLLGEPLSLIRYMWLPL